MYKSILAATALALAASAVPAAAYEGEHYRHKPAVGRTMNNSYVKRDHVRRDDRVYRVEREHGVREHQEHRGWWHRRHHWNDDYAEYHPRRRHHWWRYWN